MTEDRASSSNGASSSGSAGSSKSNGDGVVITVPTMLTLGRVAAIPVLIAGAGR